MAFTSERVPNQADKPAVLLRKAWREGPRNRKQTNANLSTLPDHVVEGFRTNIVTRRTRLQSRAIKILKVNPHRIVSISLTG